MHGLREDFAMDIRSDDPRLDLASPICRHCSRYSYDGACPASVQDLLEPLCSVCGRYVAECRCANGPAPWERCVEAAQVATGLLLAGGYTPA
jgi:hypothetical protein